MQNSFPKRNYNLNACRGIVLGDPSFTFYDIVSQKAVLNSKILTFIMVTLATGTNFPAVNINSLLAVEMMKDTHR
jgi:hypothetical protein